MSVWSCDAGGGSRTSGSSGESSSAALLVSCDIMKGEGVGEDRREMFDGQCGLGRLRENVR